MTDNETIKLAVAVVIFISLSLLFIGTFNTALSMERSDIPLVNDAWASALQAIHDDSESNPGKPWEKGIITSWWDFGHHFKFLSDRAVTFDGGTQVTPQAHWVGELLLSSDEDKSRNILRMLDCGGNNAFDELNKVVNDSPSSIRILETTLTDKKVISNDDLIKMKDGAPNTEQYLYCNPTSGYVIASEDMIGKAGVWGHFGLWDFNRADMWINVKKMPRKQAISYMLSHNYTKIDKESEQLWTSLQTMTEAEANNWLAPWPGYAGVYDCSKQNSSLVCNGIVIRDGEIQGDAKPQSFVYIKDGQIIEKKFSNSTLGYSMILTPDNKLVLSSPELANSLFTKLFFLNGTGLKNFQLLTKTQNIDGFKIYVYKVKW